MAVTMIDNTITNVTGIIPFDSDDPAVVMQYALLDDSNDATSGYIKSPGATYDPIKGISGAGTGCVELELDTLGHDYVSCDNGGQLSFEMEAYYLALTVAPDSVGYDHAGNGGVATHIQANSVSGNTGNDFLEIKNTLANYTQFFINKADQSVQKAAPMHSLNSSDDGFVRITLSWTDGMMDVYLGGLKVYGLESDPIIAGTTGIKADAFKFIRIGSLLNDAQPSPDGCHFRNIILSNRPVMMAAHPKLNIGLIGDSYLANMPVLSANDLNINQAFAKHFANKGLKVEFSDESVAGREIDSSHATPISDQATDILAKNPRIVCVQGGTNDILQSTTAANLQTGMEDIVTTLLDAGVEHVVFSLPPDPYSANGQDFSGQGGDAAVSSRAATISAAIATISAWGDANGYAGQVHVVDTYTAFGGVTADLVNYRAGNYHPSGSGSKVIGELLAEKVYSLLT